VSGNEPRPGPATASAAGTTGPQPPLLEVTDLTTYYPVRRGVTERLTRAPQRWVHAVDGVSFRLARGEMMALVGESGCGKTTTAQTILGMVKPTSGAIRLNGTGIAGLGERQLRPLRRTVQMIYQDPYESLDPRFRVRESVEEPMLVHGIGGSRAEREAQAVDALERVGLSPARMYLDRFPHELSGGQRQRVAIAAALVLGPGLLLADEPVSMLDVSVRAGVLSLLDTLRRDGDMGILMITHDLSTAARRRARPVGRGGAQPAASLHQGAPVGGAQARSPRAGHAPDPHRRDPEPHQRARGLPVPPPLPGGAGTLPAGGPTAAAPRRRQPGPPGRLPARLRSTSGRARRRHAGRRSRSPPRPPGTGTGGTGRRLSRAGRRARRNGRDHDADP
jgi:ABC-type oligopeptide transport system ATPase subunit